MWRKGMILYYLLLSCHSIVINLLANLFLNLFAMLQVQALHLAESYMNDADCHSYIRRLLALPFFPAEHMPPMMTRLHAEHQNTWIDSTLWTPDRWSVFYRTVRTNNDVERWHHRLNQNAQKDQLPLYVMIQLLFQEATTVNLQMRLYRDLQGKIMKYWEQYAGGQKTLNSLLRSCAHLNAPTL